MIYTVTLNPSIDYIVQVENFQQGVVNRSERDRKQPGGKGINVSRVLKRLGHETKAIGFLGGFTGAYVRNALEKEEIGLSFIEVEGDTRINVKIKGKQETELNGTAPLIKKEHVQDLLEQLTELEKGDVLVLAGSVPQAMPQTIYRSMTQIAKERGAFVAVDTSGEALHEVLAAKPSFIKPNHHELSELVSKPIASIEDAIPHVQRLIGEGIESILVSFAGDGALFASAEGMFHVNVPSGEVRNSVGAGDSVVAGFLAALQEGKSLEDAVPFAVAAGSATAFSDGFCTREEVERLQQQLQRTIKKEG
jgi:1-phosphofructokinase